jgi:hypothetical protein
MGSLGCWLAGWRIVPLEPHTPLPPARLPGVIGAHMQLPVAAPRPLCQAAAHPLLPPSPLRFWGTDGVNQQDWGRSVAREPPRGHACTYAVFYLVYISPCGGHKGASSWRSRTVTQVRKAWQHTCRAAGSSG